MGSTIDDLAYETHLEDIHKSYLDALENFAKSKNLSEMKKNLEHLKEARETLEGWMNSVKGKDLVRLEAALHEITNLDTIYKTLVEEKKASQRQFWVGTFIGVLGLILAIGSHFIK